MQVQVRASKNLAHTKPTKRNHSVHLCICSFVSSLLLPFQFPSCTTRRCVPLTDTDFPCNFSTPRFVRCCLSSTRGSPTPSTTAWPCHVRFRAGRRLRSIDHDGFTSGLPDGPSYQSEHVFRPCCLCACVCALPPRASWARVSSTGPDRDIPPHPLPAQPADRGRCGPDRAWSGSRAVRRIGGIEGGV